MDDRLRMILTVVSWEQSKMAPAFFVLTLHYHHSFVPRKMSSFPHPYTAFGKVQYHTLTMEADGVLRVSFSNGKVNSWIEPMWREFDQIFRFIRHDKEVNAIVLSGENRCFTAGLDCECFLSF